jgi:beta-mannosidase
MPPTIEPPAATPQVTGLMSAQDIAGSWTFLAASEAPSASGAQVASAEGLPGMSPATVPGTVLTSMIVNGKYPDPLYGKIVTDTIPDKLKLKDTDYWYRTSFNTPPLQPGQRFWLRFEGVNYRAAIWLNGAAVGTLEGAFKHGYFDVTKLVSPGGGAAYLAVRIIKLDFSEESSKPSYASRRPRGDHNGGPTGCTLKNGPTFFCSAGWDWLPTVPDRNLGIWRPVSWFTTGAVRIADLCVDSTLSPDWASADLQLDLTLDNCVATDLIGTVIGTIDNIEFRHDINIPAAGQTITLTKANIPELCLRNPRLWWPNGYGKADLYRVSLRIEIDKQVSDERTLNIGIRRVEYRDIDSQLRITVNSLPILVMGGNWGLDEAFKRISRERLFNQVRLHRDANLNLIRNWCGQSTSEDFFDACDQYGIFVWQDFFYSSTEGPKGEEWPANVPRYLDNVRDAIIHYRNHPSILLWCGGNEGSPPSDLPQKLDNLVRELDPKRLCLISSAGDAGVIKGYMSGGPYHWDAPKEVFKRGYGTKSCLPFHNEVGSYSIPTLEFVQSMLPPKSWECPDNFWADRDINGNGNGGGAGYIEVTGSRYGTVLNLPDFIRKSQLMNYECIKAIYEANGAVMIGPSSKAVPSPATGVIMWMTNPAQPSFVWQMYSHDLEQHSSFFAVQHACRRVNIIMNASSLDVIIANHTARPLRDGSVSILVHNLDGTLSSKSPPKAVGSIPAHSYQVVANLKSKVSAVLSEVCFVSLMLLDASRSVLADNFYWYQKSGADNNYTSLKSMDPAAVAISALAAETDESTTRITADVKNIGNAVALMTHLQLFDTSTGNTSTGKRILPAFYSNNYLNLLPGASTRITIDVPHAKGQSLSHAGLRVDGWKIDRQNSCLRREGIPVFFNERALAVTPAERTFGIC